MEKLFFQKTQGGFFQNETLPTINYLSHVCDKPHWFYNLHKHDNCCEVLYIADGKGRHTVDGKLYEVQKGDIVIVNMNTIHAETSTPDAPISQWTFSFSNLLINGMEMNKLIPDGVCPIIESGSYAEQIDRIIENIKQEQKTAQAYHGIIVQFEACKFLTLLQRLISITSFPQRQVRGKNLISGIKQFLDTFYMNNITLTSLSEMFYVSSYHIVHEMKREMGVTPINYLIDCRIGEAQRLLWSTDMSITEISNAVGYQNVNHFVNLFGKRVGITPADFRGLHMVKSKQQEESEVTLKN